MAPTLSSFALSRQELEKIDLKLCLFKVPFSSPTLEVILQRSCMCMCEAQYSHSSDSVCVEDKLLVLFGSQRLRELAACELAVFVVDRLA